MVFQEISNLLIILQKTTGSAEIDFISQLYNLSPIIGCLLIGIGYLYFNNKEKDKKITEKENEIKELNKYIRESENENIKILEKVSNTLDKVVDTQKSGDNTVIKEIDNLKQLILLKLSSD